MSGTMPVPYSLARRGEPDRQCDVDGCAEPIFLRMVRPGEWLVVHGWGEAAVAFDHRTLFVTDGYHAWAREIHAYDARAGGAGEAGR